MGIVGCWFQRTLKQLEREQTDRQTDTHSNPRACAPRVNEGVDLRYQAEFGERGGAAGVGLTMHP